MLRALDELERYKVSATDGDLGRVLDFLFDDERWAVRYLVVETGTFFSGRKVLISPISFREVDWSTHRFHLALTTEKIRQSPRVDTDKPVSRQHEREYYNYYGYPYYWGPIGVWGMGPYPGLLAAGPCAGEAPGKSEEATGDAHLRSAEEVRGYHLEGSDGAMGFVADFLVDDETWEVRYLVVDVGHWWEGQKVLVAPNWASRVSWEDRKVFVNVSRAAVKNSPPWDRTRATSREYEAMLHDHYGRRGYWVGGGIKEGEGDRPRHAERHPD
ncbi:MAG: PRC-barrel domain-containing protein [Polyangiaceae bacterium]